ncbi:MAG: hypothetical protein VX733_15115, partial [Candidatus Latescibacterota bacterium]|nr:hypothetical protein [Candidatus Latescibacterota bacterium]
MKVSSEVSECWHLDSLWLREDTLEAWDDYCNESAMLDQWLADNPDFRRWEEWSEMPFFDQMLAEKFESLRPTSWQVMPTSMIF